MFKISPEKNENKKLFDLHSLEKKDGSCETQVKIFK